MSGQADSHSMEAIQSPQVGCIVAEERVSLELPVGVAIVVDEASAVVFDHEGISRDQSCRRTTGRE